MVEKKYILVYPDGNNSERFESKQDVEVYVRDRIINMDWDYNTEIYQVVRLLNPTMNVSFKEE